MAKSVLFFLFLFGLVSLSSESVSQSEMNAGRLEIEEISLNDPFLIDRISTLIDSVFLPVTSGVFKSGISPFWQGAGYIRLDIWNHRSEDIRTRYVVTAALDTIEEEHADSVYPSYFTYIRDRIVLVYCQTCIDGQLALGQPLDDPSKAMLRQRLEPFLVPPTKAMIPGKDGNPEEVDFRIQYYGLKPAFEILVDKSGNHQISQQVSHYL